MNERTISALGWIATCTAVVMYLSYVDQILRNITGDKGSFILPLATILNCALWLAYGWARPRRDWPIIVANAPGVVLGLLAFVTAL